MNNGLDQKGSIVQVESAAPVFSVFTPTYNRAHTLDRLYQSLLGQTFRDFEWIVVDDGSSDDTRQRVEGYRASAPFEIRYEFQENRGKYVAFNRGVRLARGAFFSSVDSDDELTPSALEAYIEAWRTIPAENQDQFAGVVGLCIDDRGDLVGNKFPQSPFDCIGSEIRYRYGSRGERQRMDRIEVLREFPFPEPEGVKYFSPSVIFAKIDARYKERFINSVVRKYWIHNSAGNQITKQFDMNRSAYGLSTLHQTILNEEIYWLRAHPLRLLRSCLYYVRFSLHRGLRLADQLRGLNSVAARLGWLTTVPFGMAFFALDRVRMRNPNARPIGR